MLLDEMCNRYGQRPSLVFGINDDLIAYDFDCAVMVRSNQISEKYREDNKDKKPEKKHRETPEQERARIQSQFDQVRFMQKRV